MPLQKDNDQEQRPDPTDPTEPEFEFPETHDNDDIRESIEQEQSEAIYAITSSDDDSNVASNVNQAAVGNKNPSSIKKKKAFVKMSKSLKAN